MMDAITIIQKHPGDCAVQCNGDMERFICSVVGFLLRILKVFSGDQTPNFVRSIGSQYHKRSRLQCGNPLDKSSVLKGLDKLGGVLGTPEGWKRSKANQTKSAAPIVAASSTCREP